MKRIQKLFLFVAAAILVAANAHGGRWISRDPMEVQEHMERDPQPFLDLNPYTFAFNSPLNAIDPDGREAGFIYRPGGGMENALSRKFNPPSDPVAAARQWVGFTDYSFVNPFEDPKWYFRGIKCNKFVGDCISECPSRPKPFIKAPTSGKLRYPLAREWADPSVNIPGYGPPHMNPQPGDVVTDSSHLGFMDQNGYIEAPTHGPVKFLPFNNPLWNPGIGRSPLP